MFINLRTAVNIPVSFSLLMMDGTFANLRIAVNVEMSVFDILLVPVHKLFNRNKNIKEQRNITASGKLTYDIQLF
jgi:hypothetical protein